MSSDPLMSQDEIERLLAQAGDRAPWPRRPAPAGPERRARRPRLPPRRSRPPATTSRPRCARPRAEHPPAARRRGRAPVVARRRNGHGPARRRLSADPGRAGHPIGQLRRLGRPARRRRRLSLAGVHRRRPGHRNRHPGPDPRRGVGPQDRVGRTHMYLEDVLKLRKGSVVPLDKLAGDPVDIASHGPPDRPRRSPRPQR